MNYLSVAAAVLILIAVAYVFYRAVKATPPPVRKFSLLVFVLGLVVIEIYLRMSGAVPGFIVSVEKGCPPVTLMPKDSLVELKIMTCDTYGINKFDLNTTLSSSRPLNGDGFRSPYEFSQGFIDSEHVRGNQVLFFIGDSWTYGLNADSDYCFASVFDHQPNYRVLNAGIPGTDLSQYKAIVKAYILSGKLKPDKVVVCISRNDLHVIPERKLTPGTIMMYCTNAGGFLSYFPQEDTVLPSARETYGYILERYSVIGILGEGWLSQVICKSVIASRLVGWFSAFISVTNEEMPYRKNIDYHDPTEEIIREMKRDCAIAGIPVVFILLPSKFAQDKETPPQFEDVISLNNNVVAPADYPTGVDDHPNNEGHRKLFVAIKQILDTVRR